MTTPIRLKTSYERLEQSIMQPSPSEVEVLKKTFDEMASEQPSPPENITHMTDDDSDDEPLIFHIFPELDQIVSDDSDS